MKNGKRIYMQEVGTRDGLQAEAAFVATEDKIALVNALSDAGLAKIEVTAFVSPKAIPALRDAEVVLREIARRPGVVYSALVPNVRGAERAIESKADELNLVMSASESHNLSNLRMLREQSFAGLAEVAATREGAGRDQRLAVVRVRLPDGRRRARGDRARVVRPLRERDGRAWRHVVRHHRHGVSDAGVVADARVPRTMAADRTHAPLPQHARHGPGERARRDRAPVPTASTRRSAASAAAPTHPAPAATCAAKRSCTRSS